MNWQREGAWFERSECGRFTVSAAKVDGKFWFQAYHGKELLKTDADPEVCRQACAYAASIERQSAGERQTREGCE